MRAPICADCLKTEDLCKECSERKEKGELSDLDVNVSRYLYKLEKTLFISNTDLVKTHDLGDFALLIVDGNIAPLIGKQGRMIKQISMDLGRKVRIVAKGDVRNMVQDIISPARLYGINVLFKDGSESYTVVIPDSDKKKVIMSDDTLRKALSTILDKEVTVRYS